MEFKNQYEVFAAKAREYTRKYATASDQEKNKENDKLLPKSEENIAAKEPEQNEKKKPLLSKRKVQEITENQMRTAQSTQNTTPTPTPTTNLGLSELRQSDSAREAIEESKLSDPAVKPTGSKASSEKAKKLHEPAATMKDKKKLPELTKQEARPKSALVKQDSRTKPDVKQDFRSKVADTKPKMTAQQAEQKEIVEEKSEDKWKREPPSEENATSKQDEKPEARIIPSNPTPTTHTATTPPNKTIVAKKFSLSKSSTATVRPKLGLSKSPATQPSTQTLTNMTMNINTKTRETNLLKRKVADEHSADAKPPNSTSNAADGNPKKRFKLSKF